MPEHHTGQLGGTMRLGKRRTNFKTEKSLMSEELFSYFDLVLRISGFPLDLENLEISWNFKKFNKYHGKMT